MSIPKVGLSTYICGDARDVDQIWDTSDLGPAPTAIITSPPYGDLKDYGSPNQIGFGQTYEQFLEAMDEVIAGLTKISTSETTLWLIVDTYRQGNEMGNVWSLQQVPGDLSHLAVAHGWSPRDVIIWQKDRTLPWSGKGRLRNSFEYVLMFVKGRDFKFNVDAVRTPVRPDGYWMKWPERHHPSGSVPTNVWTIPIPVQGSWRDDSTHLCPLPPELVRRLVLLSTDRGDTVLDPFAGSGTVLTVASELGRTAVGVDISEDGASEFEVSRPRTRELMTSSEQDLAGVDPGQLIQARRIKFAHHLARGLAEADFPILLVEVANDASTTELRADVDLVFVFEPGAKRPSRQEVDAIAGRSPLSKYGLNLRLRMISTGTWLRETAGRAIFVPKGRGFWRMAPVESGAVARRVALRRVTPPVVCSHPPHAFRPEGVA